MRRNRKDSVRKERIIMITSSVFVLAALTMTGIYMEQNQQKSKDDGYTIDFTAMEDNGSEKLNEIALNGEDGKGSQGGSGTNSNQGTGVQTPGGQTGKSNVLENDLDYMPMDSEINLTGFVQDTEQEEDAAAETEDVKEPDSAPAEQEVLEEKPASGSNMVVARELTFSEEEGLTRPIDGEVLLHYSMDGSIYFETLDQYKYNPAVIFQADEGTSVVACAEAKVVDIYEDTETGHTMVLDLGNGYHATYGQLKNIQVSLDSYVEEGDVIAEINTPTKYYSEEGSNLYFELTREGEPVNPENLMGE